MAGPNMGERPGALTAHSCSGTETTACVLACSRAATNTRITVSEPRTLCILMTILNAVFMGCHQRFSLKQRINPDVQTDFIEYVQLLFSMFEDSWIHCAPYSILCVLDCPLSRSHFLRPHPGTVLRNVTILLVSTAL